MTRFLGVVGVAYLLGSIPFGLWFARLAAGADPRRGGSGATGATNVTRVAGAGAGGATLLLDVAKGALAAILAERFAGPGASAVAAFAAVLGHTYPPWPRGTGGKGVATAAGALAWIAPVPAGAAVLVFLGVVIVGRIVSRASLAASATFPAAAVLLGSSGAVLAAGIAIAVVITVRHRENLARLRAGTEPRLGRAVRRDRG